MHVFSRFSLRHWLTVPYGVLTLVAVLAVGGLSYQAGREAVDTLAQRLLLETVGRIGQAVERHLVGSGAVLETAFPAGLTASSHIDDDLPTLKDRLWAASNLHTDPNHYVYYGNEAGQFVGMLRHAKDHAEMRVRHDPNIPRRDYQLKSIAEPLPAPEFPDAKPFDARTRPWYQDGRLAKTPIWTSVYIDFVTLDLVVTRAKRVPNRAGDTQGVVATDVPLTQLNRFVTSLKVSDHGVAFLVEPDGQLLASSRTANVHKTADGSNTRMKVSDSGHPLQVAAFAQVQDLLRQGQSLEHTVSQAFTGPDGGVVQLAAARLRDNAGLDWLVVVAVPRSDFMSDITQNVVRTALIAALAAAVAIALGLGLLGWLSRDLQQLTDAARRLGEGALVDPVEVRGTGGIGKLAATFRDMQIRLRTDPLTGQSNRDWFTRRLAERVQRYNTRLARGEPDLFGLMFLDLNKFKQINDTLGHDAGDRVLIEVGQRLRAHTRAEDTVARLGGDEFVVLLEGLSDADAGEALRQQLETLLREPLQTVDMSPLGGQFHGGSVGLALSPATPLTSEALMEAADQAMYLRKQHRR